MRSRAFALLLAALATAGLQARPTEQAGPAAIPPTAERAYQAIAPRFDARAAMDVVAFMDKYWRIAGNPGFNASIDDIRERLLAAGFSATAATGPTVRVDEFANAGRG